MSSRILVFMLLYATSVACKQNESRSSKPPTVSSPISKASSPKVLSLDQLIDAKGNLVESDQIVAGLRLPRGLRFVKTKERWHMYETTLPLEKIQKYFGRRLITGEVDRKGHRVFYRGAVPIDVTGGIVKLDVGIYPSIQNRVRIEITELRPMAKQPLTDTQVRSLLKEQQKYMQ